MKARVMKIVAILIIFEIAIITALSTTSRAENENFTLTPNKTEINVNDTITVDLNLTSGIENQNQLTVIIKYDSSKLEIIPDATDADENGILLQDESIYSNILNSEDGIALGFVNDDGSISIVYYTNSEEKYLATSGILAKLKFKAIKGGTAKISYDTIEYAYENDEPTEVQSTNEVSIKIKSNYILGDISGDEIITAKDLNMLYAHLNGTKPLAEEALERADVTGEGDVTAKDLNRLYAHLNGTKPL